MKIYLDTLGCRLNQSEIERFAGQFRSAGHEITASVAEADYIVVNTCAVTAQAASDSRSKIRHVAQSGQGKIIVTGCWSTLEAELARGLPGVSEVIPNSAKENLVAQVLGLNSEAFDLEPLDRSPLPGVHLRTRAFIKAQDGCDNHCTFCITRIARGKGRSRPAEEVLKDARHALFGGTREIVLTGVHLGSWGRDLTPPSSLRNLIEYLLSQTDAARLRLSSLEPWNLDEVFFSLWSGSRLCPQLHLPLQSGCARTLHRMARKVTPEQFAKVVDLARGASAQMAVTTDVIVGFPGETDAEFAESLDFVRQMNFAGGHVFAYSERAGTAAVRMQPAVPLEVRKERSAQMRAVIAKSGRQFRQNFIGQTVRVLWEATNSYGPEGWHLHGLTENGLRISCVWAERLWNTFSMVRLTALTDEGLQGVLVEE